MARFDVQLEDRSHPYIAVDMSRCIDCYRCVRICDEVQGQRVWHVRDRGLETRIVPDGPSLRESSCVGCGACVDTCPTGALEDAGPSTLGCGVAVDANDVSVLWDRLRDERRHARRSHRVGAAGARRAGQQGSPVRQGPVCL